MGLANNIENVESLIKNFLTAINPLLQGRNFYIPKLKKPINAARFPDEIKDEEKLGIEKKGIYIFWTMDKDNLLILYVGRGHIENRFYSHIGKGYSWERDGSTANFPWNFAVNNHPYVDDKIKEIITNANFNVTAIPCDDSALAYLIESFLIFTLEPIINIDGRSEKTLNRVK